MLEIGTLQQGFSEHVTGFADTIYWNPEASFQQACSKVQVMLSLVNV
jgi:hypothetical protein